MLIDSHCHLTLEPLYSNIKNVLKNCNNNKISSLLTISTNLETSKNSIKLADLYDNIYCTIGIHPTSNENEFDNFDKISSLPINKKIIGIGETGLDFYKNFNHSKSQIKIFEKHIELARKLKLPVVVHTRDAEIETLKIIKKNIENYSTKFLIHCFTGSLDFSRKLIDLGCFLSFSGIITFKNANQLRNVVKYTPMDQMLIETDSPFLAPEPYRGKINEPSMIKYIAERISAIKSIPLEKVALITSINFKKFFFNQ